MEPVVTLKSVTNVVPATPTKQPCWSFLSNFDLLPYKNMYTKVIWYYKPSGEIEFDKEVSKLQESLSKVLVDIYLPAGRLQKGEDGRMAINCNDAGVTFRVASTAARFDNWEYIEDCSIKHKLTTPDESIEGGAPLMQVQVTQFACGGITLGLAIGEAIVDGYGGTNLIKSWSEVHRGLPISTRFLFKMELLKARSPPQVLVPIKDYLATSESQEDVQLEQLPHYEHRFFVFDIQKLVKEIENGPFSYGRVTSFEAMSALLWKYVTEARDLEDHIITRNMYSMSLRNNNRWDPPLPSNLFGYAVHASTIAANADDLKSKHVSYAAKLIHEDILDTTAEHVSSAIDWLEIQLQKPGVHVGYQTGFFSGRDIFPTSVFTFPCYESDFGWGPPELFAPVVCPFYGEGFAMLLGSKQGGRSRQVCLQLPPAHFKRLLNTDFVKFAFPKGSGSPSK